RDAAGALPAGERAAPAPRGGAARGGRRPAALGLVDRAGARPRVPSTVGDGRRLDGAGRGPVGDGRGPPRRWTGPRRSRAVPSALPPRADRRPAVHRPPRRERPLRRTAAMAD